MSCTFCDVKKTVKSTVKKNFQRTSNQKVISRVVFEKLKWLGKEKPKSDLRESKKKKFRSKSDKELDENTLHEKVGNAKSDKEVTELIKADVKREHPDWDDATIDFLVGE